MLDEQDKTLLRANLQQVLSAAGRAKDLVKQILAFSRQSEPKKMPVQVGPLVKEGLKLLRSSLPASIEIRQNIAVNRGSVLADPVQIHQVLMNLCTNAGQAMRGTNGILDVELTENDFTGRVSMPHPDICPGPYITLSVKDTGHGMTSNTIERIFDPYFTTKKPGEGTGLGLAVVHGIVKACGGAITVASKPGEGSAFQVFFPRVIDAISGGTELPASLPKGTERILVVDDEAILTEIMRKILERLGYEVTARTSSKEALEVFRSEPGRFDAVITDMTMPIITGNELARELMRVRPDIPIILCTGFSDTISADEARAMGIREYLMKPIVASDLAQSIRRALEPTKY
jgi:CheY-like chemotaxis protein